METKYNEDDLCYIFKQYLKFHNKYSEIYDKSIVLMMVGQFYEIYAVINDEMHIGPDLNEICDILNIHVAKRNNNIQEINLDNFLMAGFPDHALVKYKNILLNNNYTIILVDQITPSPNPERDVVEIISPATTLDHFNKNDTNYLLSVYLSLYPSMIQKKKIYLLGVSLIDITTGNSYVHKIQSSVDDEKIWKDELFRFIHYYSPSEILIHYDTKDININKEEIIAELSLNDSMIHINTNKTKEFYKPSYQNDFLSKIYKNKEGLSAVEFLNLERETEIRMSFIFMIQFIYEHKIQNTLEIKKPIFIENEKYLNLTYNSIYQLNLIKNYQSVDSLNDKCSSLLSLLNNCHTAIGRRLCKERLLYPILDINILNDRYEYIKKFQNIHDGLFLYDHCKPYLKKIFDVEKIIRKLSLNILHPYELNNLLISYQYYLKITDKLKLYYPEFIDFNLIENINKFKDDINHFFILNQLRYPLDKIENYFFNRDIYPEIDKLNDDYIIKQKYLKCICDKLGFYIDKKKETIKINSNDKFGWFLSLTQNRSKILMERLKNIKSEIEFKDENKTFLKIDKKDIKIKKNGANYCLDFNFISNISDELILIKTKIQAKTKEKYLENISILYKKYKESFQKSVQSIGLMDINCNIAKVSLENVYCCPKIIDKDNKSYFISKDLRHPLVEKIKTDVTYVPNDVSLTEDGILLFGTNACGKSTLMKSVGLSLIMAQAGFFVPCSSFEYYPYTQIFTRILNNDNIFTGESSFAVEMSELRSILLRSNEKSLILGDELCSGTENVSALSIVSAGLKTLSDKKCSFIFTSHLHQLMDVSIIRNIENLKIFHLKIIYDQEKELLIYDRKLVEGSGPPIYGLEVCKAMDLGNDFISLARKIQLEITDEPDKLLNNKISNYNKNIMMDKCMICLSKAEHTHHIKEQNVADENNIIDHFHKNVKHNLVQLCESCHHKVHNENLRIYGYIQTSEGIKLNYEYIKQEKVIEEKKKNKKFNDKQIKIIIGYKDDIINKTMKKAHCIKILELEHHIQISSNTLTKIINDQY